MGWDQPNNGPVTPQTMTIDSANASANAINRLAAAMTRDAKCSKM